MNIQIQGSVRQDYSVYNGDRNRNAGLIPESQDKELSSSEEKALKRAGLMKCETCASRKYQDGSSEANVSFKSPGHIDPGASAATVMSHEQEHVSNAYQKAARSEQAGVKAQVVSVTVSLQTAICPECGRSYVSGGQTNTSIRYEEQNPYGKSAKSLDAANGAIGMNVDVAV